MTEHIAASDACPRCGHDNPGDPTRRPNGDHLVREEGSLTLGRLPDADELTFRFTATQDVRFVWCSTRDEMAGA